MNARTENAANEPEDLALLTLREIAEESKVQLPMDLIEALYLLQKKHQFDPDRGVSLQEMQKKLEQYVDENFVGVDE